MKNTEFREYLETYVENLHKVNDRSKVKFFLAYLRNYLETSTSEASIDTPAVYGILDKAFLLGSIECYIRERQPARNVAESYRRTVIEFLESVCKDYNIKSDFLESNSDRTEFNNATAKLFSDLKQIENRACMSTDDYETLNEAVDTFLETNKLEELIIESIVIENYKPNHYERLVSTIAIKLVQKYGLANKVIANLDVTDLNMNNKSLECNGFSLPIDEDLFSVFTLYLKSRSLISSRVHTDKLFVKKDGNPYLDTNGNTDSGQLFLLMDSALGHTSISTLRYRRIVELVTRRVNVNLLYRLTGVKEKTIERLCCDYADDLKADLYNVLNAKNDLRMQEQISHPKGQIRCPFCGDFKDASSDNWILVQVDGDTNKRIACRECKGLDGKYRY